MSLNLSESVA